MGRGYQDIMFDSNDGCIACRNRIWVQRKLAVIIWMFEWVGLYTNLWKIKSITYTHRFIWGVMGKEACK